MKNIKKITLRFISNSSILNNKIKVLLLKKMGLKVGYNVFIGYQVYLDSDNIIIGNNCTINTRTSIITGSNNLENSVIVGDRVQIGPNCNILAITHEIGDSKHRAGNRNYKTVEIKSGSWLGGNVTILPGVTIAEGCVIAAGSVVTKRTDPNFLYAGVPALRKKKLK